MCKATHGAYVSVWLESGSTVSPRHPTVSMYLCPYVLIVVAMAIQGCSTHPCPIFARPIKVVEIGRLS